MYTHAQPPIVSFKVEVAWQPTKGALLSSAKCARRSGCRTFRHITVMNGMDIVCIPLYSIFLLVLHTSLFYAVIIVFSAKTTQTAQQIINFQHLPQYFSDKIESKVCLIKM